MPAPKQLVITPGMKVKVTQQIAARNYTWTTEVIGTVLEERKGGRYGSVLPPADQKRKRQPLRSRTEAALTVIAVSNEIDGCHL